MIKFQVRFFIAPFIIFAHVVRPQVFALALEPACLFKSFSRFDNCSPTSNPLDRSRWGNLLHFHRIFKILRLTERFLRSFLLGSWHSNGSKTMCITRSRVTDSDWYRWASIRTTARRVQGFQKGNVGGVGPTPCCNLCRCFNLFIVSHGDKLFLWGGT